MKKKQFLAVAIVFCLIVLSFSVRSTFAKYKSSVTVTDDTRVARWGINMSNEINLLENSSLLGETTTIAPGSSGIYRFRVDGTTETSHKLKINVSGEDHVGRIVYYLDDPNKQMGMDFDTLKVFLQGIVTDEVIEPNGKPMFDFDHTITWEWPMGDADSTDYSIFKDKDGNTVQPFVTLNVEVIAEQVTK